MTVSKRGLDLIKKHEGFRNIAYRCPANVWTIGYGNTAYPNGGKVQGGDCVTRTEANELLKSIVSKFEFKVSQYLEKDLNQNQFDALVSFSYNVGAEAFRRSTLLKVINSDPNDLKEIERQFKRWNKAGGRVLRGLMKRRNQEFHLYQTPI